MGWDSMKVACTFIHPTLKTFQQKGYWGEGVLPEHLNDDGSVSYLL
jgi:hypothetical protein